MNITVITFEDHGQDFLTWTVDEVGKILDCQPFQFSIWSRWTVDMVAGLKVGGKVRVRKNWKKSVEYLTIDYPISRLEVREKAKARWM